LAQKRISITEEQFNKLIQELNTLRKEIEELRTSRTAKITKKPVLQSIITPEEREETIKEEILSSPLMKQAVEYIILDYRLNPPKRRM